MNKTRRLTENMALFCKYYYSPDSETFGNGIQSYRQAYPNCKSDKAASVQAARLLVNTCIVAMKDVYQAELAEKLGYDAARCASMQQAAYDLAMSIKQPAAASTAGTAIARLFALDKDASADKPEQATELSKADIATLQAMSKKLNEADVDTPTIHKLVNTA